METQIATRQEIEQYLDDTISRMVDLEEEIGIIAFFQECINAYYRDPKTSG